MYYSEVELRKIVDQVISVEDVENHPFRPDDQIRVCSIDIRIGKIFWKYAKRHKLRSAIDLGSRYLFQVSPRRHWTMEKIEDNGSITLKPGEMILGQTYEKISIPDTLVGKINTRSSYARLGLSTACNCDLINPGYVGNVPIELINHSNRPFVIRPFLPVCQIFLMNVQGDIGSSYSDVKYRSKYMDDDGGPSRWWRDTLVENISKGTLTGQIEDSVIEELQLKFSKIDDDGLLRLEKFVDKKQYSNSAELLQEFYVSEKSKYRWRSGFKAVSTVLSGFMGLLLIQIQKVFSSGQGLDIFGWLILMCFFLSLPFTLYFWFVGPINYYSDKTKLE